MGDQHQGDDYAKDEPSLPVVVHAFNIAHSSLHHFANRSRPLIIFAIAPSPRVVPERPYRERAIR
jgi:hypothetical protein